MSRPSRLLPAAAKTRFSAWFSLTPAGSTGLTGRTAVEHEDEADGGGRKTLLSQPDTVDKTQHFGKKGQP